MHAKVIRPYSHSLSDDERLYKTPEEREAEARRDPITRMRQFLHERRAAPREADIEAIAADVDREIADADQRGAAAPKPATETADWYVFSPDVDPTQRRSTRRRSPRASPTRWSRPSIAR